MCNTALWEKMKGINVKLIFGSVDCIYRVTAVLNVHTLNCLCKCSLKMKPETCDSQLAAYEPNLAHSRMLPPKHFLIHNENKLICSVFPRKEGQMLYDRINEAVCLI